VALVLVVRAWGTGDVEQCVEIARLAHVPVYTSMRGMYGEDLFARLRPDWAARQGEQVRGWFRDPALSGLIAESDGQVVGFVASSADLPARMGSVEMVVVAPEAQRTGIGSRLVRHALGALRDRGVLYAQAFIREFPGHEPALRTFRSTGFERRAVQPVLLSRPVVQPSRTVEIPAGIRRVVADDVDQCVRFGLEAFRPVYASFHREYGTHLFDCIEPDWERSQAVYIEEAIKDPDDETWVYELQGRPVGFLVLKMDEHGVADIDLLAVDPTVQRRGIAAALNRFAVDRAGEAGMRHVVVATADDAGHALARRSYERAGFEPMVIQWNLQIARL
jgi:ribosomal protein S18 acetylase RimI-like enzyme